MKASVTDAKSGPFGSLAVSGGASFGIAGPFAGGQPGSGVFLNGTSGNIAGSGSNSYNFGTGGFTIEAWVKTDITGAVPTGTSFVYIRNNAGSTQINLGPYQYTNMGPVLTVKGSGGGPYSATASSPPAINDNQWHHLVATYSYGSPYSSVALYVDGAQVGYNPTMYTGAIDATGYPAGVWIGLNIDASNRYVRESISNVAIYSAPLPSSAVNCHYNTAKGLSCGAQAE